MTKPSASRGFVLAAVLFAVVLLSAAAASGFFAAFQEVRGGRNAQSAVRARAAAEAAVASAIANWDPRVLNGLAPGAALATLTPVVPGLTISADVHRLDEHLFLVRARASEPAGAEQAASLVVRLAGPETAPAAVRARSMGSGLGASASGSDSAPAGWACPPPSAGAPAVLLQPGAPDSVFFRFGSLDWAGLAAWAAAVPAGGDSIEVSWAPGDSILSGGRGIGVLVVGGDLTLRNYARYTGLVVVHGRLILDGLGGQIDGAVVASQVVGINGYSQPQPAVAYSSCAVLFSALSRALPERLPGAPIGAFF